MPAHSSAVKDPRAIRSRTALRRAFLKLLRVKSLDQITIRDIAAKAGVGHATFYRHHLTKEALLDDVAAEQISRLINLSLPVMDAHNLRTASVALITYINENRSLWTTLLTGGAAGTIRQEFHRQAREVAESRGRPDAWLPAEVGVSLIVGGTIDLLTWWLRQSNPLPIERIAEILVSVIASPAIRGGRRRAMPNAPW